MADQVCDTGLLEDPDDGWSPDMDEKEKAKLAACQNLKGTYMRMASDSPSVRFLAVLEDVEAPSDIVQALGVKTFPTVVFFKGGEVVWRTEGSARMSGDMAEGVLYFGNSTGDGRTTTDHMIELTSRADYDAFLAAPSPAKLKIVMVTTEMCTPCIRVYPSAVTLAMNFRGLIDFARLSNDDSDEVLALFGQLRILEVPSFLIFHEGAEVSRNVSSNRGDLIGHILQAAMKYGITPPKPKKM